MTFDTQTATRCRHGKKCFFAQMFLWCMFSIQGAHSERVRDGSKHSFGCLLVIFLLSQTHCLTIICVQHHFFTNLFLNRISSLHHRMLHKQSDRPHYDLFYFAKTTNQPQANLRIVQLVKRLASNCKVVGSIPAQTTWFFGFFFFISKEKVRACFFAARINQPTSCYFGHNEVRKKKKSGTEK